MNTSSNAAEDFAAEIDIIEVLSVLWDSRLKIILFAVLSCAGALLYVISLPDIYQAEARLVPKIQAGRGQMDTMMGEYSGLASLAGFSFSGSQGAPSNSQFAIEKLQTLEFFEKHIFERFGPVLLAVDYWDRDSRQLFYDRDSYDIKTKVWALDGETGESLKPSAQQALLAFRALFSIGRETESGVITLTLQHQSPLIAHEILSHIITAINEEIREKDIAEAEEAVAFLNEQQRRTDLVSVSQVFAQLIENQLQKIMLANVSKNYVFDVLEPPFVPEKKFSPSRSITVLGMTALGGFLGMLVTLITFYYRRQRSVTD